MQLLEVSGAVRPIYGSLGVKRLILRPQMYCAWGQCPICPTLFTAAAVSVCTTLTMIYQPLATVHVWSLSTIS